MTNLSGKRIVSQPVLILTEQFGHYSQTIKSITTSVDIRWNHQLQVGRQAGRNVACDQKLYHHLNHNEQNIR